MKDDGETTEVNICTVQARHLNNNKKLCHPKKKPKAKSGALGFGLLRRWRRGDGVKGGVNGLGGDGRRGAGGRGAGPADVRGQEKGNRKKK